MGIPINRLITAFLSKAETIICIIRRGRDARMAALRLPLKDVVPGALSLARAIGMTTAAFKAVV
jgi:hypothetical protein